MSERPFFNSDIPVPIDQPMPPVRKDETQLCGGHPEPVCNQHSSQEGLQWWQEPEWWNDLNNVVD